VSFGKTGINGHSFRFEKQTGKPPWKATESGEKNSAKEIKRKPPHQKTQCGGDKYH